MRTCDTFWGSHGCELDRRHRGLHECGCCSDDSDHQMAHETAGRDAYGVDGCVATWPYYGAESMSGPDAKLPFFMYSKALKKYVNLPDEFARMEALKDGQ